MAKRKTKRQVKETFDALVAVCSPSALYSRLVYPTPVVQPRMGSSRFQLLAKWIDTELIPCSIADIGGGKGLLAYHCIQLGWNATVIDPHYQTLPSSYKDISSHTRVHIPEGTEIPYVEKEFSTEDASSFDLLVGLHSHGSNIEIIDGAAKYTKEFILLPCCVINEPLLPPPEEPWIVFLARYAIERGFRVIPFPLGFSGQNLAIYGSPQ